MADPAGPDPHQGLSRTRIGNHDRHDLYRGAFAERHHPADLVCHARGSYRVP